MGRYLTRSHRQAQRPALRIYPIPTYTLPLKGREMMLAEYGVTVPFPTERACKPALILLLTIGPGIC